MTRFRDKLHHAQFRTFGTLHSRDRLTEWWTVTNEETFYRLRDAGAIPYGTLFAHDGPGGLVVYLDSPGPSAVKTGAPCPACGHATARRSRPRHPLAAQ